MNTVDKNNPRQLMVLAKDGDRDAFAILYDIYFVPIFRYIYYRVKNKEQSEDITQSIFLKIYKSLHSYNDIGISPQAYFFKVAKNTLTDYWKKKKDIIVDNEKLTQLQNKEAVETSEINRLNTKESIKKALEILNGDQRDIIVLKFINELSNKEIAKITEKNEAAIRQIQCRALKKLSNFFKD